MTALQGDYDVIIIGAGSLDACSRTGFPQRARARPAARGRRRDNWMWFHVPVGYLFAIGNPRADWLFRTEPEPGLNGRVLNYPRGKVIGGCSAINAMIHNRGQSADYDGWRQLGLTGWGWDDVLPHFLKHEDHVEWSGPLHAQGGEWRVENPRVRWEILDAFMAAAEAAGIPRVSDFNAGDNEGVAYFQVNQRRGRRWSAATGFLKPVLNRPNLRLETGVLVDRLTIADGRVTGVRYSQGGQSHVVTARDGVILSAGAVASPAILMRSGIGPAAELATHGIDVLRDHPGVGANLQDHLQLRPVYKVEGVRTLNIDNQSWLKRGWMGVEYALFRSGPLTMAPSQLGAFARSGPERATPNLQFHVQPLSLERFGEDLHPFAAFTASVCNLRPTSRGKVGLRSADPQAAPVIQPNYLSTQDDRDVAVAALKLTRNIVGQAALARYRPQEFRPGPDIVDDAALARAAGDLGTTIFHPVGTVAMGPDGDPAAVLDGRLRLRGLDGLRVVDASVMPRITSANTAAPTMMIAEKAAAMIADDGRI